MFLILNFIRGVLQIAVLGIVAFTGYHLADRLGYFDRADRPWVMLEELNPLPKICEKDEPAPHGYQPYPRRP